ncbi:MAG: glutathione S-transferase [Pseudanabaena sp.]|nr:MAG: glutathione S-transferase [Pseudanabaena sp.]
MITIHHLNNSRSQRILWLLEELEVAYEIKFYKRDSQTMLAPQSLRDIHPLGKSPVLTDGQNTVAESGAIIEYILKNYGGDKLRPEPNTKESLLFTYWLHYAEGSAMPPLVMSLVFTEAPKQPMLFLVKPIIKAFCDRFLSTFVNPQIKLHIDFLENEIKNKLWFAGQEFSAADIQLSFPLEAAAARGNLNSNHPNLLDFLKRIHSREAYQKALQKGGTYNLFS